MSVPGALLRRELQSFFYTPLAWIVLTLFLLVVGYSFYLYVELFTRPDAPPGGVMQHFFGGTLWWLVVIFTTSVITMRSLAEERRAGTIEPLMTAPVSETQVVLLKYLAAVLFYSFLWVPTLAYVAILSWVTSEPLPWGPLLAGYGGTLMVGATCISVGMLASALCRSQIVAAVLTFALLCMLLLLGVLEGLVSAPLLRDIVGHLSLFAHIDALARGIVDSRHVVLHLTLIVFFLVAAAKALEAKKWR